MDEGWGGDDFAFVELYPRDLYNFDTDKQVLFEEPYVFAYPQNRSK